MRFTIERRAPDGWEEVLSPSGNAYRFATKDEAATMARVLLPAGVKDGSVRIATLEATEPAC